MTDLKQRILAAAAAEPSPSRSQVQRRRVWMTVVAALAMAAGYSLFALWLFGWQAIPRSRILLLGTSVGAAVVAGAAIAIAVGRGGTLLGRSRGTLIFVTAVVPLLLLGWKLAWSALFGNLDESPRLGYRCLAMSVAMGVAPLLLLVFTRKGEDPRHPGLLGAAIGVAVAACGWFLVDLWCPVGGIWHLLRGHLPPILLLGGLGAIAGSLVASVRRKG